MLLIYLIKIRELTPQNNHKAKRLHGGQVAQLINNCKIDLTIITIFLSIKKNEKCKEKTIIFNKEKINTD